MNIPTYAHSGKTVPWKSLWHDFSKNDLPTRAGLIAHRDTVGASSEEDCSNNKAIISSNKQGVPPGS